MSFCNKILATIALTLTLAAPAVADGTPGQRVNRGPAPVQAHQPAPPEPGCYLIEDGKAWSCPARPVEKPIQKAATNKPCCGTLTRTVVKKHPPVVTKRTVTHRAAPPQQTVTRRAVTTRRAVQTSSDVRLDVASFAGGVGNGVGGSYYGGGGAVFISSGHSYSGVMSHSASSFTFRHRRGGKRRGGGGGGCGCMGGGD